MIAYRAMLDVPRALVVKVARFLAVRRRELGTRKPARALSCYRQALLVLVWLRTRADLAVLATGFGISRATAYRYRDETVHVLARQAPDLHDALAQTAAQGWSHVILDGKLFRTDQVAATTTSRGGTTINLWYSGRHHAPGGNVQAVMRPDGLPIWTSEVRPGRCHDLTAARTHALPGVLGQAATRLGLPTLADSAYDTAGPGVLTPIRQPRKGRSLDPTQQTFNALHRATRALGERGFALLTSADAVCNPPPSARAESAHSSAPASSSPSSRTVNYTKLTEITSLREQRAGRSGRGCPERPGQRVYQE